jgi:hypothetical protein
MNREHVGMIFKFLPEEEREELYNLKDEMIEVYSPVCGEWILWSDLQKQEENDFGCVESCLEDLACRPKGFKSFIEMFENNNVKSETVSSSGDVEQEIVKIPRQYSLVRVSDWYAKWTKEHTQTGKKCPLLEAKLVFMGEIPNMPGHCLVMDKDTGKPFFGYHTDDFIELTDKET